MLAAGSIALGAVAVAGHPQLSDDLYRYTWDGRVQAAGIDPYRYPPDDPHLARLRDGFLWPDDVTCRAILRQPGCTRLNRPDARTIYPPLAELWFRALYATGLSRRQERGLQAASAGLHLALAALVAALRGLGRDPRLTVLYAWCPLAVLESAVEAHLEPLAALGAVGAVWACARGRAVLPGLLLGAGTAVKLLPALLAPVILRRRPVRAAAAGGTAIAAVGLAYLPHVLAVGPAGARLPADVPAGGELRVRVPVPAARPARPDRPGGARGGPRPVRRGRTLDAVPARRRTARSARGHVGGHRLPDRHPGAALVRRPAGRP